MIIASWPADAPRGAVTRFCREHGVSREWFYATRKRVLLEGLPQALVPRSRRPTTAANRIPDQVEKLAVAVRERLKREGWDYGPLSVKAALERLGVASPSRATLARIFTRNGLVTPQPKKRPRSSWGRFRYAAPNECWQLDATDWTLADGTVVAIFQLNDDHSRYELASLAARSENAHDALRVVQTGIQRHGVPQRLLSDNGTALNPSRRGWTGLLTATMNSLGVHSITSTPGHPQTQGKNERGHSTLKRWLKAQPAAHDLAQLQQQLDRYDDYYNQHRPHQSLDGLTPLECYTATPKAAEPTPPTPPIPIPAPIVQARRTVDRTGILKIAGIRIMIGRDHAGDTFTILLDTTTIMIFDHNGLLIRTHPHPSKGSYIPNGKPRGFLARYKPSDPAET